MKLMSSPRYHHAMSANRKWVITRAEVFGYLRRDPGLRHVSNLDLRRAIRNHVRHGAEYLCEIGHLTDVDYDDINSTVYDRILFKQGHERYEGLAWVTRYRSWDVASISYCFDWICPRCGLVDPAESNDYEMVWQFDSAEGPIWRCRMCRRSFVCRPERGRGVYVLPPNKRYPILIHHDELTPLDAVCGTPYERCDPYTELNTCRGCGLMGSDKKVRERGCWFRLGQRREYVTIFLCKECSRDLRLLMEEIANVEYLISLLWASTMKGKDEINEKPTTGYARFANEDDRNFSGARSRENIQRLRAGTGHDRS